MRKILLTSLGLAVLLCWADAEADNPDGAVGTKWIDAGFAFTGGVNTFDFATQKRIGSAN